MNASNHAWVGLATGRMTRAQADAWGSAIATSVDTPMEISINGIICRVCDLPQQNAPDTCSGPPPAEQVSLSHDGDQSLEHHWIASFALEMTDDEVVARAAGERVEPLTSRPQGLLLACGLCGQVFEEAGVCTGRD